MRRLAVAGILIGVVCNGCSIVDPDDDLISDLNDERREWSRQNIRSYTYEFDRSCFCQVRGVVVIRVENDAIVSVTVKSTGEPVTQQNANEFFTIPGLYAYLIDAAERADEMTVTFDRHAHLPAHVQIDFIKQAADDELALTTQNFLATGTSN